MMQRSLFLFALLTVARGVFAQGTAFTYQGRLDAAAAPANGLYDFRCQLYDAQQLGASVSTTVTSAAVPVTNGLFVLNLDFGPAPFNGGDRWLLITVRTNNALNFTTLTPRQHLAPAPYAIYAGTAGNLVSNGNQVFSGSVSFNPASGPPFSVGSSSKVSNLNADFLDGLDSGDFVKRAGDTMIGNLVLTPPASIRFGNQVRQMLHLFDTQYGIGVQANATYFRSHNHFAWFKDGVHADNTFDPGAGGQTLMTLGAGGNLVVNASSGIAVLGDASNAGFGVGVRGEAGAPFGAGLFGHAPLPFSVGVNGTADGTNSTGVFGRAMAATTLTRGVHGVAESSQGYGVYGENNAMFGTAVYGVSGGTVGTLNNPAGVYGESLTLSGNGVVGVANNGPSAYGVWGRSSSGFAGAFDGAVRITGDSSHTKPFLQLRETEDGDYARIQLQVANRPLWHISVGGGDNSLVFYNSANSIVTSVSEAGLLTTRVLTITGGADIAEPFEMSHREIEKGAVVIIDDENPGKLKLSERAYDTRVAGIVSGAGGVNAGLTLQQTHKLDGGQQVALSGRVYVQADASTVPIRPGDLLTTSDIPGHAMRVSDPARAQGAILGKAMTGLAEGKGLVLVLVTLQ